MAAAAANAGGGDGGGERERGGRERGDATGAAATASGGSVGDADGAGLRGAASTVSRPRLRKAGTKDAGSDAGSERTRRDGGVGEDGECTGRCWGGVKEGWNRRVGRGGRGSGKRRGTTRVDRTAGSDQIRSDGWK